MISRGKCEMMTLTCDVIVNVHPGTCDMIAADLVMSSEQ
jgi:hypothetical protein